MRIRFAFLFFVVLRIATSQVGPFGGTTLNLTTANTQLAAVPAGVSSTLVGIVVDARAAGEDVIDVNLGDVSVVISLIAPNGTQTTAGNPASLGFTVSTSRVDRAGGGGWLNLTLDAIRRVAS
jgi:hypothetical protein